MNTTNPQFLNGVFRNIKPISLKIFKATFALSLLFINSSLVNAQNKNNDSSDTTSEQIIDLVRRHFEILNDKDSIIRINQMTEVYHKDFHIIDTYFEHYNYKDFNESIEDIHKIFPEAIFSPTNEIQTLRNAAKVSWKLGNEIVGEDIFLISNGKIQTILAFVEKKEK